MTKDEIFKQLNEFDADNFRQEVVNFLKLQIEEYKTNPERGEEIAYDIAGLMSTKALHGLPEGDPLEEVLLLAGELELPEQHRSEGVNWDNFVEKVKNLEATTHKSEA